MREFTDYFDQYFSLVSTQGEHVAAEAQRLRYQVYCLERKLVDASHFPDQRERDAYDHRAVHCLIRERASERLVGSVRLVLPDAEDMNAAFPVEICSGRIFTPQFLNAAPFPRTAVAEPSRFVIASGFRRRGHETTSPSGLSPAIDIPFRSLKGEDSAQIQRVTSAQYGVLDRRVIPHITLGLIRALVETSAAHGIRYWFVFLEPVMLRKMTRLGLLFGAIGPLVEHEGIHGQPSWCAIDPMLAQARRLRPDVWQMITANGRLWPVERGPEQVNHREDTLLSEPKS